MGAGILATNSAHVADRLAAIRDVLDSWIDALRTDGIDAEALKARLEAARAALDQEADT